MKKLLIASIVSILAGSSSAQTLDEKLRLTLETPQYSNHIGQIGQIRGWALTRIK